MDNTLYGAFPMLPAPEVTTTDTPTKPTLPNGWQATAILHPYSPPPDSAQQPTPFFQLCVASIAYIEDTILSVQITGLEYGNWWYKITPGKTTVSTDRGATWTTVDTGWTLPTTQWLGNDASYFSTSYLNWMEAQQVEWWKQPVENSNATTWIWFDQNTRLPFRMMFGAPPPSPTKGNPVQLALFQNFSFTYFPSFAANPSPNITTWQPPVIEGFQAGNPNNNKLMKWNDCFAMTTLMTPVDSKSMPLPTLVLYQWKPDDEYQVFSDRTQCTMMSYEYNPQAGFQTQVAMLYGIAPASVNPPPPLAGSGYIFNETIFLTRSVPAPIVWSCNNIGLGEEPPNWASITAADGTIHATVSSNPALCPNEQVDIISVIFPPTKEYPQGRYLWTWYSPFPGSDGSHSRPVTFMESASNIAEGGTSLALADYYAYAEQPIGTWFDPAYFQLPAICTQSKEVAKD